MATTASNVTSYKSVQISDCWLAIRMCGELYFHDGFSDVMFCPLRYLLIVPPKFCVKHITGSCLGGCSRFTSGYLLCPLDTPRLPWHQIRTGCDIAKMGLPQCRTTKISHVGHSCGIQPSFRCITPCTVFLNLRSSVHLTSFPSPECGEVHVCRPLALQSAMTRNSNIHDPCYTPPPQAMPRWCLSSCNSEMACLKNLWSELQLAVPSGSISASHLRPISVPWFDPYDFSVQCGPITRYTQGTSSSLWPPATDLQLWQNCSTWQDLKGLGRWASWGWTVSPLGIGVSSFKHLHV